VLVDISTGAHNDLERATDLVRKMITEYGMSEELGPITFGRPEEQVFMGRDFARERNYSEATAYSIDKEAHQIIEQSYQKAKKLLGDNLNKLHRIATTLLEKETIERGEFEALMQEA
jgi:cell division protease FtsH